VGGGDGGVLLLPVHGSNTHAHRLILPVYALVRAIKRKRVASARTLKSTCVHIINVILYICMFPMNHTPWAT